MSDELPEFKTEPQSSNNYELYKFHLDEADRLSKEADKRFQNSQKKAFLTRADSEVNIAIYLQSAASYHMERAKIYLNEVEHEHKHGELPTGSQQESRVEPPTPNEYVYKDEGNPHGTSTV